MDNICRQVWIATEADAIKTVKTALEQSNFYDKATRIRKIESDTENEFIAVDGQDTLSVYHSLVPTTLQIDLEAQDSDTVSAELYNGLQISSTTISKHALFVACRAATNRGNDYSSVNCVTRAVRSWLEQLDKYPQVDIEHAIRSESWSHQIYFPMLLLGPSSFESDAWQNIIAEDKVTKALPNLYQMMCSATSCTHVAINAAIPLDIESDPSLKNSHNNVMRSPLRLVPLYGNFGSSEETASRNAFEKALWVSTMQNGIYQIFAPIHTMFSRGNVKEKARVLQLAQSETKPYTAVDLYCGIGYFAFSYAKGGAAVVLGWEINEWSVEGFRRGSSRNHWDVKTCGDNASDTEALHSWLSSVEGYVSSSPKLVVFAESNEAAPQRVRSLRDTIPPVRHVNCGYLPSSKQSWHLAVQCLDPDQGGYIHVHENVGMQDIDTRRSELQTAFKVLVEAHLAESGMTVLCEHVERVKSYAPGVWHCVFDIEVR